MTERKYHIGDVEAVMDSVTGWAQNWNQVIDYLRGPGGVDLNIPEDEVPDLVHDFELLRDKHVSFSTDYRQVWRDITGEDVGDLPPKAPMRAPWSNPAELRDRYLVGLSFPAGKEEVLARARQNGAPQRVLDVLGRVEDRQYDSMDVLLEAVGNRIWDVG